MEILGRAAQLPATSLEWVLFAIVLGVLVISAWLVAGTPTAIFGFGTAIVAYLFDARIFIPAAMALAAWLALMTRGPRDRSNSGRRTLREAMFLFGGFALYEVARHIVEGDWATARSNAASWLDLESRLHLDVEYAIQSRILTDDNLITLVNSLYSWSFLAIVVAAVYWTFIVDDFHYRIFRNALGVSCAFAVMIMALHPTAPPRLLPGSDLIGTHALVGGSHSFVNEFAAVPSLHVGWLALTGVILFWAVQSRWRWFWLLGPVAMMQFTVMATGHHFFLDGVVGSLIAVGPAVLMRRSALASNARRQQANQVAPDGWLGLARQEVTQNARVQVSFYGLSLLLAYLVVRQMVDKGFTHYWGYQVFQIAVSIVFLLAVSVYFRKVGGLSWFTHVIIVLTTWADSLGTAGHMYDRHVSYDKITHFMGCMAAACLVCDILFCMQRMGTLNWSPLKIIVIGAATSMVLGAGWEIYEYYGDKLFDTGRFAGMEDTSYDIISDAAGAIAGAIVIGWMNLDPVGRLRPAHAYAEASLDTDMALR